MEPIEEKPTTGRKARLAIDLNVCASQMEEMNFENVAHVTPEHDQSELNRTERDATELEFDEREESLKATNVVKHYHGILKKAVGGAAPPPGQAGLEKNGELVMCQCCGNTESLGKTIICDGCESSFHVGCMKLRQAQAAKLDDWVCRTCNTQCIQPKWPVGRIAAANEVQKAETAHNGEGASVSEKERSSRNRAKLVAGTPPEGKLRKRKRKSEADIEDRPKRRLSVSNTTEIVDSKFVNQLQLPLECMDLRIESFGTVDLRPGYSDANHTWPVGFCSLWHDTLTGSICISQVLEGGPSGPVFRVTRRLCSSMPDMGKTNEVQESGRGRNTNQIDNNYIRKEATGNLHKLDAEGKQICINTRTDLADPNSTSNLETWSGQLHDEEDELHSLISSLQIFSPENAPAIECAGFFGKESAEDLKIKDLESMGTDPSNDRTAILVPDKYVGLGAKSTDLVSGDICKNARSSTIGFANLFEGSKETMIEDKQEQIAAELVQWSRCSNGNFEEIFVVGKDSNLCPNDAIGEIIVEASSSAEAWTRLAKEFVVCYRESLTQSTNSPVRCFHLEVGSSSPSLCLKDLLGIDVKEPGNKDTYSETLCKALEDWIGRDRFGFDIPVVEKVIRANKAKIEAIRPPPPPGRPIGRNFPAELVGDLLQIWEFLCRFYELLGHKDPPSLDDLEEGLYDPLQDKVRNNYDLSLRKVATGLPEKLGDERVFIPPETDSNKVFDQSLQHNQHAKSSHDRMYCHSTVLAAIHISLLKILLGDLQPKVLGGLDVIPETKRGKKKDGEPTIRTKKQSCGLLPLNEMTWPEVARRYVIALTLMDLPGENMELSIQEHRKLLRCLLGDGGVLCGALDGVAGIETDAQLLAEAEKQVFGRRSSLGTEQSSDDKILEQQSEDGSTIPEWAVVLEPVRKLATNVGARIRNCVRDALSKDPPEWAKEILEWSISKEVYKGNASGPTKRAVLQVLAQVTTQEPKPKINIVKKKNYVIPTPALVMKRCRLVLRQLITSDEWRVFCNLLSGTVLGYYESKDDRSELAPVMVPRPLDFRIIDSRLATGAYGESHESFLSDMQQLWRNIPVIFHDREDMIKVGESLSQQFEALYQDRVINLINRKEEPSELGNSESFTGLDEKFMKAPWEEGVCKICGIDKDDDLVLLCDGCDAEYHIYCLNPPLSKIPEGNWYCPSCIAHDKGLFNSTEEINKSAVGVPHAKSNTEKDWLISVCTSLGEREYWQLNVKEKILLLKFLCDKALDSGVIRDHLEQCGDTSLELQQKLRSLLLEYQSHAIRSNSLAEENSEVASRETGRPKRRSGRNLRASDISVHVDGSEMLARVLEETEKLHSHHIGEGGGMEMLQTKTNMQAGQLLDGQPSKQQNALFPSKVYDIKRTTDDVLNDLNIPLEVLTEEQGDQMTTPGSESKEKAHASSRVVVEVPANSPASVPQEESYKHYKQLDGKLEEHLKIDHHFEVGTIRRSDFASLCNENGSDLLVPAFIVQQQLHEVPKADERNNVKVNGTSEASMKVASSISPETQAAVLQDNKGMENTGELDHSLCLNHGIKSGSDQTLLPQVNMGEQPALQGANAIVELNWPAQAASLLETEIENLEVEIGKTALRRECLGRDLSDRTYWSLVWGGKVPYLAVEVGNSYMPARQLEKERKEIASHTKINDAFSNNCIIAGVKHQPLIETGDLRLDIRESNVENWIMYETDSDFEQLLQWLNPKNQQEKNLISAIMQWQMLFSYRIRRESLSRDIVHKQQTKIKTPGVFLGTKATLPYVRKHGPIRWPEKSNDLHVRKRGRIKRVQPEDGMFRCDCLELVWPTRCHCELCHETFESSMELQNHNNGVCFSRLSALQKQSANMPAIVKPKKRKGDMHIRSNEEDRMHINRNHKLNGKRHISSSFDFSLVVKRFHIQSSTRERILQIGCIADGGPIFVPAPPFVLDGDFSPPTTGSTDGTYLSGIINIHSQSPLHNQTITVGSHLTGCQPSNKKPTGDMVRTTSLEGTVDTPADKNLQSSESEDIHQNAGKFNPNSAKQDTEIRYFIPVASIQPLPATSSIFFKKLKASLLDIEAVLAPEAFERPRGDAVWRRSWRFFVKSATSIYGLIQALITLEQMLKADCLKESWCHWASLSSAVKTTTLSSLALRIFSLDAAIKYKNIRVAFDLKNDEKSCKR